MIYDEHLLFAKIGNMTDKSETEAWRFGTCCGREQYKTGLDEWHYFDVSILVVLVT